MREQLQTALPMVVVPALPDKKVVGRFTPEVVNARLRGLQRFLSRCAKDTNVVEHVVFQNFLSLTTDEFATFRDARNAVSTPAMGAKIMGKLSSLARMMGGGAAVKRTDADISVDALEKYASSVEPVLGALHTMLLQLQQAELATAQALSEFGSAYGMLGAAERRALGDALQATGQCARQVATVVGSAAHHSSALAAEDMLDAQRMVQATQHVFNARKEARNEYAESLESLQRAKVELSKAGGGSGGEAGAQAAAAAADAQVRCTQAEQKLHSMTLQLAESMERFREQHLRDFMGAWCQVAVAQARRAAVEAELWEGIADRCQEAATVEASAAPYLSVTPPAVPAAGGGAASSPGGESPSREPADAEDAHAPDTPQEYAFADGATPSGDEQGEFV